MSKTYSYETSQVDATMWMVRRTDQNGRMDEQLLRDVPEGATSEEVVELAIKNDSWA